MMLIYFHYQDLWRDDVKNIAVRLITVLMLGKFFYASEWLHTYTHGVV